MTGLSAPAWTSKTPKTLLREEVLSRMRDLRDGGVEVFAFRDDGTIISYDDEIMVGRSIREVFDDAGAASGALMLAAATGPGERGFFGVPGNRARLQPKRDVVLPLSKHMMSGDGLSGAAIGMDAMERAIASETATYRQISFRNVAAFVVLFIIAVGLLLYSSYVYSRKIKAGLILFTDFFRAAADSNIKIDRQALVFAEFEETGRPCQSDGGRPRHQRAAADAQRASAGYPAAAWRHG